MEDQEAPTSGDPGLKGLIWLRSAHLVRK